MRVAKTTALAQAAGSSLSAYGEPLQFLGPNLALLLIGLLISHCILASAYCSALLPTTIMHPK